MRNLQRLARCVSKIAIFLFVFTCSPAAVLTHQYTFQNNLNDVVGSCHGAGTSNATYTEAPSFAALAPAGATSLTYSMRVGLNGTAKKSGLTISRTTLDLTQGSISLWVKPGNGAIDANADYILSALPFSSPAKGLFLYFSGSTSTLTTRIAGTGAYGQKSLSPVTNWYHIVLTWDNYISGSNGVAVTYINGQQVGTCFYSAYGLEPTSDLRIGNYDLSNNSSYLLNQFTGHLYDLRIYEGTLTSAEVAQLYQRPGVGLSTCELKSFYSGQSLVRKASEADWQWHPLAIGTGGYNLGLTFDPKNSNRIYLTSDVAGAIKSSDQGAHWRNSNRGLQGLSQGSYAIGALAVDPSQPEILYASVGCAWKNPSGIVRSVDFGETWQWLSSDICAYGSGMPSRKDGGPGILVHPTNGARLYAINNKTNGGAGGVWTSTNSGVTWAVTGLSAARVSTIRFDPSDPGVIWASALNDSTFSGGLFRSTDGGVTWSLRGLAGKDVYNFQFEKAGTAVTNSATIYATAGLDGVFRTTDGGLNWTAINNGLPLKSNGATAQFYEYRYRGVDVDPSQVRHVVVTADVIRAFYESYDGGVTWTTLSSALRSAPNGYALGTNNMGWYTGQIYFHPTQQNKLYICDFFGTWSRDGVGSAWTLMPYGNENSCMVTVLPDVSIASRLYLGVWDQNLIVYTETSTSTNAVRPTGASQESNGTNHHVSSITQDRSNSNTLLAVANSAALIRSTDRGNNWTKITAGLPASTDCFWRIGSPAIAHTVGLSFLPINGTSTTGGGVYTSTDGGLNWRRAQNSNLPEINVTGQYDPRQNVFDVSPDGSLVALISGNQLFLSLDQAATWTTVTTLPAAARSTKIVRATDGTLHLLLGCDGIGGLYKSSDRGGTWSSLLSSTGCVELVAVDPNDSQRILAYSVAKNVDSLGRWNYTLSLSENGGQSWTSLLNDSLAIWRMQSIAFDPFSRNRIFGNTFWGGAWVGERP